ncbi:MAG: Fic family protein [Chloroflexia bacterium]|nr:Fic family protein [Chloroflexia bacterium]MDQ3512532.1 Fic family protein [Chloroflexota bacterium]
MSGGNERSLLDLLTPFRLTPDERARFQSADPDSIPEKVNLLTAAALYFNSTILTEFGGHGGSVRAPGMVEQVIAVTFQTFGDVDPYPEVFAKAAMLLRGIAGGHPFHDGNKRTGFVLLMWYLDAMGTSLPPAFDVAGAVTLCVRVAAGDIRDIAAITTELVRTYGGVDEAAGGGTGPP